MEVSLLNTQRVRDMLQDYSTISRKSMGQAINNFLGDVALTAIRTTYKSNKSKIEAELTRVVDVGPKYLIKRGLKDGGGTFRRKIKTGLREKRLDAPLKLANWILKNQGLAPLGNKKIGIAGQGFGKSSGKQGTIGRLWLKINLNLGNNLPAGAKCSATQKLKKRALVRVCDPIHAARDGVKSPLSITPLAHLPKASKKHASIKFFTSRLG